MTDSINSNIVQLASLFKFDPELIAAFVEVETSGLSFRVRHEPSWHYFVTPEKFAPMMGITLDTEKVLQSCSWGLMQIMGSVARERGFYSDLPRLTDNYLGIYYGCCQLNYLRTKFNYSRDELISAYNAGHPTKSNQSYVDKVNYWLQFFQKNGISETEGGQ
jgi:hypothetical protein